jgi:hypothetical protein
MIDPPVWSRRRRFSEFFDDRHSKYRRFALRLRVADKHILGRYNRYSGVLRSLVTYDASLRK